MPFFVKYKIMIGNSLNDFRFNYLSFIWNIYLFFYLLAVVLKFNFSLKLLLF